jgi:hypothetical protein
MRFRSGLLLLFLATIVGVGCRKPLTPNVDTNLPPETWITQAPQDTITFRDDEGVPRVSPIGTIPVRFHMYWAGSDHDGAVNGFYWAVVETLDVPPPGLPMPPLPGPKPRDYRYTTKTDSVFVFNVSEERSSRAHAFFIYAVDDKGKPDATPARFIFNSLDRFPPDVYIFEAFGQGPIYRWDKVQRRVITKDTLIFIRDSLTLGGLGIPPKDTVPAGSRLVFRWRTQLTAPGSSVTGFRYKLDESVYQDLPPDSTQKTYAPGQVAAGTKKFELRVLDEAQGANDRNRRFQMNMGPDSWFAGPDPASFPLVGRDRVLDIPGWSDAALRGMPILQDTFLSSDSLTQLPAERPFRKTFFELYRDKLYIRTEGDTVHLNSWLVFHGGGVDLDSPYSVKVGPNDPDLGNDTMFVTEPPLVVRRSGPNGSPTGMQFGYTLEQTPFGSLTVQPRGVSIPVFDPADVQRGENPAVGAYIAVKTGGRMFFTVNSVDGNNGADRRVSTDPRNTYNTRPDLRPLIMTFYVNKNPFLLFNQPGFVPRPDTTFFTRLNLGFNLPASDIDPYDYQNPPSRVGGPSSSTVLRWTLTLKGKAYDTGNDTTFVPPGAFQFSAPTITVTVPDFIRGPEVQAIVELCDCRDCEIQSGGRCVTYTIPFKVPARPAPNRAASSANDRPGQDHQQQRRSP